MLAGCTSASIRRLSHPVITHFPAQLQSLFAKIDAIGNGTIARSEREKAVTATVDMARAANTLFAQLPPGNIGGISEQSFAQALQPSALTGNTVKNSILALFKPNAPPIPLAAWGATAITADNPTKIAQWALPDGGNWKTGTAANAASTVSLNSAVQFSTRLNRSHSTNQVLDLATNDGESTDRTSREPGPWLEPSFIDDATASRGREGT